MSKIQLQNLDGKYYILHRLLQELMYSSVCVFFIEKRIIQEQFYLSLITNYQNKMFKIGIFDFID